MRTTASTSSARPGKPRLLASCAIAAGLAALATGGPALAQVAGSGSIVSGSGSITPPGPGATTVTTTTPQAIVNWTPTDTAPTGGAIDFLPAGNTLNFVGTGSYTVLNRFVDGSGGSIARQIALNGTVNSYVGSTTGPRGGNIWFYNAGGILIGSTGVINVGSLVLTANDIDTTGGLFGPGGTIRFNGASGSQSAITVNGTINASFPANPGGSYVALVAPRIVQAGTVRVDGSVAYVAAEQADIRINNGLFDINVLVGAEGGTAITHSGTTTGPAHQQGDIDQSRIYMVAIPKNDAVTMLVSGQVGYDDAVSAQTDPDGAVVLSAGYNIVNGEIAGDPVGNAAANITVNDTIFRSDTTARASGAFVGGPLATIPPPGGAFAPPPHLGLLVVQGNGLFIGDTSATFNVGPNQLAGATGNLELRSTTGNASMVVNGGLFLTPGALSIFAGSTTQPDGSTQAGTASLTVAAGGQLAADVITVAANGDGVVDGSGNGLAGRGGVARMTVTGSGSRVQSSQTSIVAIGSGGDRTVGLLGGDALGGTAELTIDGDSSTLAVLGNVFVGAGAQGGDALGENSVSGGAIGGNAVVAISGVALVGIDSLAIDAAAQSGTAYSPSGTTAQSADAQGGTARLSVDGGSQLQVTGGVALNGSAIAGDSENVGRSVGGSVSVAATAGSIIDILGSLSASADAASGLSARSIGPATGGAIDLTANGGRISFGDVALSANATTGRTSGAATNEARGGSIRLLSTNGGDIAAVNQSGFNLLQVNALAGRSAGGTDATGGDIEVVADGGSISFAADTQLVTNGVTGGDRDLGFLATGRGGNILLRTGADSGSNINFSSGLFAGADGRADLGNESNTFASGTGGNVIAEIQGGSFSAGSAEFRASGFGSAAEAGAGAATGTGGTAIFVQTGGLATFGDLAVRADGIGGTGSVQADGGDGIGGTATITLLGGTIDAGQIIAAASGIGGHGGTGNDVDPSNITDGGRGGQGVGGTATINIEGDAVVDAGLIGAYANGAGGQGGQFFNVFSFSGAPGTPGDGGSGAGGNAAVNLISGSVSVGDLIAGASAVGGAGGSSFFSSSTGAATGIGVGGTGGAGSGGVATINVQMAVDVSDGVSIMADGIGGNGGSHNVGGNGGNGFGGLAQAIVENFDSGLLDVTIDSSGRGGNGADGNDGDGGNGGGGFGGTSRVAATGAGATATVSGTNFRADGIGGNGGNGRLSFGAFQTVGTAGGHGGEGRGGAIEIAATNGATLNLSVVSGDAINLASTGRGGNGGNGADNFGSILLPGPDGIFATADDIVQGFVGGSGGTGGAGMGGTVILNASGGTITSNGEPVEINVNGVSGDGGNGGNGTGGGGSGGGSVVDGGGTVFIEAAADEGGTGLIDLGDTVINANGFIGGRIVIRSESSITMASLDASALGLADPTSGDLDEATSGIFLAATGGTIATTGSMSLATDSSVGIYATGTGQVSADGDLTIDAGDQIDIRHMMRGSSAAPSVAATDNLTANGANGISGAAGSLIATDGTLTLASSAGPITVDRLDGGDIRIDAAGAVSVEHAEAANDFIASGASFRTGLNSIITGGNILVNSPGAVDLGNSTAGGLVQVSGESVLFNTIGAGGPVFLTATGNMAGAEVITGGSINAGGNIILNATRIDITGTLTTTGSLFAVGSTGPVSIALAEVEDDISIFAGGDLTGIYNAEGVISLTSTANIDASANATGFQSSSSGPPIASSVFINAGGNVTLNDNSATGMFGVNAGGAVTMTGGTIGEDLLVLAGTTATITGVTAGDDVIVTAPGGIIATDVVTTGTGRDDRTLTFAPFSPTAPATFQIVGSAPDGSNIVLTAAAGDINASNLNAAANLTAIAAGTLSATGPLRAGGNIALTAADANLATLTTPSGDRIATVDAGGNATIAVADTVTGGVVRAGGNVGISAGSTANLLEIATSAGNVTVSAGDDIMVGTLRSGGTTGLASPNGGIVVNSLDSVGAVSAAGQTIQIAGQNNLNFANLTATGGDASVGTSGNLVVATANVAGLADLRAGNDLSVNHLTAGNVNLEASRDMVLNNVTTAGSLFASAVGMATINGIVTGPELFVSSGDITIASTGRIGQLGTTNSVLVANISNQNPTFIGGTGTRNGWHLDADEITRIFGSDITVRGERLDFAQGGSVGSSRSPDVFVDAFAINAAQQLGANGTFLISTPGKMRVRGDVRFNGMANDQTVHLFGNDSVEVIMGSGSVHLSGQAPDQLAGNLTIDANDIVIATTQAIADISAMTSTAAINTRLAQNDGITSDIGALAANRITLNHGLDDSVYIQNSGTGTAFADRRGITFGQGGLFINGPGSQDSLVINAVHRAASGALVTGLDVIPLVSINAPTGSPSVVQTGFNAQSTINGCLIGNVASCAAPVRDHESSSFPVQDVIDDPAEDEDGDGQSLPVPLITMRDLDPLSGEPLLDDPVTGAGNDDLWTPTDQP